MTATPRPATPPETKFATLYVLTGLGEAIAIHDSSLSSAGADDVVIVNARRDSPDVAQHHAAEQAELIDYLRIE